MDVKNRVVGVIQTWRRILSRVTQVHNALSVVSDSGDYAWVHSVHAQLQCLVRNIVSQ